MSTPLRPGTRVKLIKPDPSADFHPHFPKDSEIGREGVIIKTFTETYKIRFNKGLDGWGYYWHCVVEEVKA